MAARSINVAFKKGDVVYHVSSSGNISKGVATADEKNGSVEVQYPNQQASAFGTFHIFSTEVAANRAAVRRSQGLRPDTPIIKRNPK
jgi:hypothetical protein